ncbi:hypothetical protein A4G20_10385 [Pasteurellaceae bacterium RH1A]|nr:hypothetical protein A4G20_10385 [Pasteurellaceae bacterium RH1A]
MNRQILRNLHKTGAMASLLLIGTFWASSLISELALSKEAVIAVKNAICYGLFALIFAMAVTGITGMKMGAKAKHPSIVAKKKRMPLVAANGLFILLPCAFYLCHKANLGEFDGLFYAIQALELLAGGLNFVLLALSVKDGLAIKKKSPLAGERA